MPTTATSPKPQTPKPKPYHPCTLVIPYKLYTLFIPFNPPLQLHMPCMHLKQANNGYFEAAGVSQLVSRLVRFEAEALWFLQRVIIWVVRKVP